MDLTNGGQHQAKHPYLEIEFEHEKDMARLITLRPRRRDDGAKPDMGGCRVWSVPPRG